MSSFHKQRHIELLVLGNKRESRISGAICGSCIKASVELKLAGSPR